VAAPFTDEDAVPTIPDRPENVLPPLEETDAFAASEPTDPSPSTSMAAATNR
jgi:hypothetical protein